MTTMTVNMNFANHIINARLPAPSKLYTEEQMIAVVKKYYTGVLKDVTAKMLKRDDGFAATFAVSFAKDKNNEHCAVIVDRKDNRLVAEITGL